MRALFHFALPGPLEGDRSPALAPICPALFADAGTSIVIERAAGLAVDSLGQPERGDRPSGFVVGPMTRGRRTSFGARVDAVGAYLWAGVGTALLGVAPLAIADCVVRLDELWPDDGPRLCDALDRAADAETRLRMLENVLVRRLGRQDRVVPVDRSLIRLTRIAEYDACPLTVDRLAGLAGISRQHLARRFRAAYGLPPKLFLRLSRYRRLLQAASVGGTSDWAGLASRCGYADQSHMIAEFHEFTGLTPAALQASLAFHPFASAPA